MTLSRRKFLLGGATVAGALVLGWGVLPPRQRMVGAQPLPVSADQVALNGWIKVASDGTITVMMHKSEMGQGIHTALQMLVAEEMDVPMSMLRTEYTPIDKIYGNQVAVADGLPFRPDDEGVLKRTTVWLTQKISRELGLQITGGSSSVRDAWQPMREAGATARAMLIAAAAHLWGVPRDECTTSDGVIRHRSGQHITYGEVAASAWQNKVVDVRLKNTADFSLIGTEQARTDTPAKVNGSAQFGIDVQPAGLLFAAIQLAPTLGASLQSVDSAAVLRRPGVFGVVSLPESVSGTAGVAVIASNYWLAQQALNALPLVWNASPHAALSSDVIMADLQQQLDTESGFTYHHVGDAETLIAQPSAGQKLLHADYRVPFLAHATMEPINCTAQMKEGILDLWVSTQVPSIAVDAAASIAGIASDKVRLHQYYLGGGFGRRLEVDMVKQAVAIAMEAQGAPVKLIWSREQDIAHDFYRPAALARFTALLDANGAVAAYASKSISGAVVHQVAKRTFGLPHLIPNKATVEGEFDLPYEFSTQKVAHITATSAVPIGYWRSVGHSHNAFFTESFLDEMAHAAGVTPLALRRSLLQHHPRHRAVLDAAVMAAGEAAEGRYHGIGLHQSFGSIVAQVAEISIVDARIQVHKIVCAVDCGLPVNPNIIRQQIESGIVFGLSAALFGEITLKHGQVQQSNFHDYPVLRMNEMPAVLSIIMPSAEMPAGVGEIATPLVAPALANALFAATGQRMRQLPLKLA